MNTEHILIYPHKEYNLHNKFANTLKPNEVVNYGYIKRRNLSKWENDEVVAVKMGMLTPSKKSYFEKTIKDAVVLRIENQDNESCFDDDDELIPVYIFVSTERDDEWRKYLHTRGFNSARKDKKREGILIKKSDIGLHYGKHYNIDTKEVLCEKERIAEEKRKLKEQQRNNFEKLYGVGTYDRCLEKQIKKLNELKKESRINPNIKEFDYHIDFNTLEIKGYSVCNEKVTDIDFECLFGWVFSIIFNIMCFNCFNLPDELLLFDGFCFHFVGVIWAILNIVLFLAVFSTKEEQIQKKYYDKPNIK